MSCVPWLTRMGPDGRRSDVTRLELKRVRVCSRCGRGRAELESAHGDRLEVRLDPPRARELSGQTDEVQSLAAFMLAQLAADGAELGEVVLDQGPAGLRALLSVVRRGASDIVSCTAQEGIEIAVKAELRLYATDEAFARAGDRPADRVSRNTIH